MATRSQSPRSQQRVRVFDAYRGRGRRNNNLWLVYSVKTQRDWILSSDRQLVHWIHYLETASSVKWFDLNSDESVSPEIENGGWSERNADVVLIDGSKEWHQVNAGGVGTNHPQPYAEITHSETGSQIPRRRVFGDDDLKPHVTLAMRWLKALGYAAAIRDQDHTALFLALLPILQSLRHGTVRHISNSMAEFDPATLYGSLVRLAIQGHVDLDLTESGFCYATPWHWHEEVGDVVA